MFVDPNAPVPPNRGGVPGRSVNDLQPMQTITDPGMQSAQQADAYAKFNNTAQYMPPPVMKKEGEKEVSLATDATKLEKGGDQYGEFKNIKMKRKDGNTVSADMSTATKDKLPELTITASPANRNEPPKQRKISEKKYNRKLAKADESKIKETRELDYAHKRKRSHTEKTIVPNKRGTKNFVQEITRESTYHPELEMNLEDRSKGRYYMQKIKK